MIDKKFIDEHRKSVPWEGDDQVEHDLVLCRTIVELFQNSSIRNRLAMLGGTALYKFHLEKIRYSEDLDFAMANTEPIEKTIAMVAEILSPWLGKPKWDSNGRKKITFKYESSELVPVPLKLKLDFDTVENFTVLGYEDKLFSIDNPWFSGEASVRTFGLEELISKKLRALLQRSKGRDFFDIWYALVYGDLNVDEMLNCFYYYMNKGNFSYSRKQYEKTLTKKLKNYIFQDDIETILQEGINWDIKEAEEVVREKIISKLPVS